MVPFERALVSSYRPFIVTFHLSLRVSNDLISPKFPHVPLGGFWAMKSKVVGLTVRAISFQDFEPM